MKRKIVVGGVFVCLFAAVAFGVPMTQIQYEISDLGSGQWQYTYNVMNISLSVPIEEFTIWFDFGLYDGLAFETPDPPADDWDEIVLQPEPVLGDDGAYDAKAEVWNPGIGVGETVSGFSVSFDWLGAGEPASQFYEIIDPVTFETIGSGETVPEPATLWLVGLGALALRRKKNLELRIFKAKKANR